MTRAHEAYPGSSTDRVRRTPGPDYIGPIDEPDDRGMTVNLDVLEAEMRSRGLPVDGSDNG